MSDWKTTGTVATSPAAEGNYITDLDIDNWSETPEASETFATDAVIDDEITVTNDIPTGTELRFSSTGILPDPIVSGVVYYAIRMDATHIKVATTPVNAAAGTEIDLTDVGSGIHTLDIGSGSSSTDRQAVIDRAEQLIESLTHDYFYSKAFVIYRNGNGADHLTLNLQPNIILDNSQLCLSDLAMVKDNTTLTSAIGGFTAAMVGEKIYISAGTNFIVGWYTITTHVDTNTVTLNKTAATVDNGEKGIGAMGGIVEVSVHGVALNTSWYTYDANSIYLDPESATGGVDDPEFLLRLSRKRGLFSRGTNNIKIIGTYGWATCPPAIKHAAIILCRYENDETLYTAYDDVVSDKLDDASYNRGKKKFLTGIHEADKLIRNHVRRKPILGAC